jgi:hypothetical protein
LIKLNYKTRRILSLLILLVGLPIYAVFVVKVMSFLVDLPIVVELLVYIFFGVAWAFPTKFIFRGIGQSDSGK